MQIKDGNCGSNSGSMLQATKMFLIYCFSFPDHGNTRVLFHGPILGMGGRKTSWNNSESKYVMPYFVIFLC